MSNSSLCMQRGLLLRRVLVTLAFLALSVSGVGADDGLGGRWRGGWSSDVSGHSGRLNAHFRRINESQVRATFHGTFAKVIPFVYRPVLTIVHEEPGLMILQGERRIPLGGTFAYEAVVSGGHFEATYRSRRDSGSWRMSRR